MSGFDAPRLGEAIGIVATIGAVILTIAVIAATTFRDAVSVRMNGPVIWSILVVIAPPIFLPLYLHFRRIRWMRITEMGIPRVVATSRDAAINKQALRWVFTGFSVFVLAAIVSLQAGHLLLRATMTLGVILMARGVMLMLRRVDQTRLWHEKIACHAALATRPARF